MTANQKEEVCDILLKFVKRVTDYSANERTPEEIVALPAIAELLLNY